VAEPGVIQLLCIGGRDAKLAGGGGGGGSRRTLRDRGAGQEGGRGARVRAPVRAAWTRSLWRRPGSSEDQEDGSGVRPHPGSARGAALRQREHRCRPQRRGTEATL